MGSHTKKSAISRRAYAKRRHVSEAAIRKRIADGTLVKALTKDGRIKPDVADRLLAAATTAGEKAPISLVDARRRKSAAAIALLQDEVDAVAAGYLPKRLIDESTRRINLTAARGLFRLPFILAALVAKKPPTIAGRIIDETVRRVLTEVAGSDPSAIAEDAIGNRSKGEIPPLPAVMSASTVLSDLAPVQLATMRTDLLARRLELRRAIAKGELGHIETWKREEMARITITQRLCLAMPHKLAPYMERATPAKVVDLVEHEIINILHHLACDAVSHAELVAAARKDNAA